MQMLFITIAAAVMGVVAPAFPDTLTQEEANQGLARLEAIYHVEIQCRPDPSTSFPNSWLDPSLRMVAAPIEEQDIAPMLPALEQFLIAHPAAVIEQNLERIYLLGELSFQDRDYGGTHTGKSMYIVWDQTRKNSEEFILERLHSEFSSILRDHHPFPDNRWNVINPEGFRYTGTGFEMLGKESIYGSNEPDQDKGFLVKYSMSSLENDFNMMSAWLFTHPDDLAELGLRHDRIQRKRALTEEFYRSISDQYVFQHAIPAASLVNR